MRKTGIEYPSKGEMHFVDIGNPPEPGPNEVLIETEYSGITNGTERHALLGEHVWKGYFPSRHGYQHVGIIRSVGKDVQDLDEGDPVFYGHYVGHRGWNMQDMSAENHLVARLPPELDRGSLALLGVAGVAMRGVRRTRVERGHKVWVAGAGLIGQFATQSARAFGAEVTVSEPIPSRLTRARELGADVKKARDLLRNAEDAFDAKKFKKVHQFLEKAKQTAEDARRDRIQGLSDSLLFVKSILDDARDIGADVTEADDLYNKTKGAFDSEEYSECKVLLKEVEQLALRLQDNQIKKAMNLRLRREGIGAGLTDIGEDVVEVEPEQVVAPPNSTNIPRYRRPTTAAYPQDALQPSIRPAPQRMRKTKCPNCGQRFPVQGGPGPIRVECPYCGMRGMMP